MNTIGQMLPHAESSDGAASKSAVPSPVGLNNMFLQLLVAQLQNQNPLNPMDPTQFVSQLAQFSELSEITQISQLLQENLPSANSGSTSNHPATGNASVVLPDSATSPGRFGVISSAVAAAQNASREMPPSKAASLFNHAVQGVF